MDFVHIFPFIAIFFDAMVLLLIAKHYRNTKFRPSLILLILFAVFIFLHVSFIPLSILGEDDYTTGRDFVLLAVFITLSIPNFTIAFFESTRNRPFNLLLIIFLAYFLFLIGFSFGIDWVFEFDRIWRYKISETVLILFMIPFAAAVLYVFIRLAQIIFNKSQEESSGFFREFTMKTKLTISLWTFGLLVRYLSCLLIAVQGVSYTNLFLVVSSAITIAAVFLYDPDSFFLSHSTIKAFLIFDAESGTSIYWLGPEKDADLLVSGLYGTSLLQKEISGASSFPNILMFIDRTVLIEYKKVEGKNLAAAMIVDHYNPIFVPSLKQGLFTFIKQFRDFIRNWDGNQSIFKEFNKTALKIFGYAYSKDLKKRILE